MLIRAADIYAKGNGNVAIGFTYADTAVIKYAKFSAYQLDPLGTSAGNYTTITTVGGSSPNKFKNSLWLRRDAAGNEWTMVRLHDGISIDGSYRTPGVDTRTWWERDPYDNIQSWGTAATTYMTLKAGNLGIGVTNPTNKLEVNGTIRAKKVVVEPTGWPDFVFSPNYKLPDLQQIEEHIKEQGHLPDIPSEADVTEKGVDLVEMNAKLLQKVEELTLYLIEQNKQNTKQNERISALEKQVNNNQ